MRKTWNRVIPRPVRNGFYFGALVVAVLFSAGAASGGNAVSLSSLDLKQMTTGWSVAKADVGIVGRPLSIGGRGFSSGVGTHAASRLRVALHGKGQRFVAAVGVDDSAEGQGSVEFLVVGDGKVLWRSGVLTGGQAATPVDVELSGVQVLDLRATDGGDGASHDHADWADARNVMLDSAAAPQALAPYEAITVKTKNFVLEFVVGEDRRLYQRPIGAEAARTAWQRQEEAYPQWGDGYIWEPALQVMHADGNTSTSLLYEGVQRAVESPNRELVRIKLRDPAYPFEVALCFRPHSDWDVVEQWAEIRHHETGPVKLERMASASLLLMPDKVNLTHFHGDWADEMNPVEEKLTPGD